MFMTVRVRPSSEVCISMESRELCPWLTTSMVMVAAKLVTRAIRSEDHFSTWTPSERASVVAAGSTVVSAESADGTWGEADASQAIANTTKPRTQANNSGNRVHEDGIAVFNGPPTRHLAIV